MSKKIQRICQWGLLFSFISGIVAAPLVAATTTDFRIQVQPLECSVDTLSSGVNTLTQLSPNCAPLEKLPVLDYRAIGDEGVSERHKGRAVGVSSSERFFYVPFPTGYDSAYSVRVSQDDNKGTWRYADKLIPIIVIALVTAIVLLAGISLSNVGLRRWLSRFKARN